MVFSDPSNKLGIVQDIDFHANTDSNSYPIAEKTRNVNAWLDRVVSLIFQADGKWEFDDSGNNDLPIKTENLVSGTQEYKVNTSYLKIRAVSVKDPQGVARYLDRIDEKSPPAGSLDLMDASIPSGTPTAYALVGNYIVFNRKPNYNSTAGLRIYGQRNVTPFTSADTTATPGFASQFHRILSLGPSLDYAIKHDYPATKIASFQNRIKELEDALIMFYSSRDQDRKISMSLSKEDYGFNETNELSSGSSFNI
jgi:hypothetical protein